MKLRSHFTGIGSLPFLDAQEALEYSFQHSIPFLPHLPQAHPSEGMIHQALWGFPGLICNQTQPLSSSESLSIDSVQWKKTQTELSQNHNTNHPPLLPFSICWDEYLKQLAIKRPDRAKVQIAGPLTCIHLLQDEHHRPLSQNREICLSILDWISARALKLCEAIQKTGSKPLLFLDEPCLWMGQSASDEDFLFSLFKQQVNLLQKHSIEVGIHCCAQVNWPKILSLDPDWISFDLDLSLPSFFEEMTDLKNQEILKKWIHSQGGLCLGLPSPEKAYTHSPIITSLSHDLRPALHSNYERLIQETQARFIQEFKTRFPYHTEWVNFTLNHLILSSSCGLALHSTNDAHLILKSILKSIFWSNP